MSNPNNIQNKDIAVTNDTQERIKGSSWIMGTLINWVKENIFMLVLFSSVTAYANLWSPLVNNAIAKSSAEIQQEINNNRYQMNTINNTQLAPLNAEIQRLDSIIAREQYENRNKRGVWDFKSPSEDKRDGLVREYNKIMETYNFLVTRNNELNQGLQKQKEWENNGWLKGYAAKKIKQADDRLDQFYRDVYNDLWRPLDFWDAYNRFWNDLGKWAKRIFNDAGQWAKIIYDSINNLPCWSTFIWEDWQQYEVKCSR